MLLLLPLLLFHLIPFTSSTPVPLPDPSTTCNATALFTNTTSWASALSVTLNTSSTPLALFCGGSPLTMHHPVLFSFTPPSCGQLEVSGIGASDVLVSSQPQSLCSRPHSAHDALCVKNQLSIGVMENVELVVLLGPTSQATTQLNVTASFTPQRCFKETILSADAGRPKAVRLADLDGDADMDVVYASSSRNTIAWFENVDGEGTFSARRVISDRADGVTLLEVVDIDGDGDVDVVAVLVISSDEHELVWFENLAGGFSPKHLIVSSFRIASLEVGDLNGDGHVDLVFGHYDFADSSADGYAWVANRGAGSFDGSPSPHSVGYVGTYPRVVHVADVDSDGALDVVYGTSASASAAWARNRGDGSFEAWRTIALSADDGSIRAVAVADIDLDGLQDVITMSYNEGTVSVYLGTGPGVFSSTKKHITYLEQVRAIRVADVDGDNTRDLVLATYFDGYTGWLSNTDGLGNYSEPHRLSPEYMDGVIDVSVGDVNGDSSPDMVSAVDYDGTIVLGVNQLVSLTPPEISTLSTRQVASRTASFNVVASPRAHRVLWDVDMGCALSNPTPYVLASEGSLPASRVLVLAPNSLQPNTQYCVHVAVLGPRGIVGSTRTVSFETVAEQSDCFLASASFASAQAFDPFVFAQPRITVPLWSGDPPSVTFATSTQAWLRLDNSSVAYPVVSGEPMPLLRNMSMEYLTQVFHVDLIAASGARCNYTFALDVFAALLSPEEILLNPTRSADSAQVNAVPSSALKFMHLRTHSPPEGAVSVRSLEFTGALSANLTHLLPLPVQYDLFLVKNDAAFRAKFELRQSEKTFIVQWSSGDLWMDAEHGPVNLEVNGIVQWQFQFNPNATYDAAVRGTGVSLQRLSSGWAAGPHVLSSLDRRLSWAYNREASSGISVSFRALPGDSGHVVCTRDSSCDVGVQWSVDGDALPARHSMQASVIAGQFSVVDDLAIADVSGDGVADIVVGSVVSLAWYQGLGDGQFSRRKRVFLSRRVRYIICVDLDGDGHMDVLVTDMFSTGVAWLQNRGGGVSWEEHELEPPATLYSAVVIAAGDLSGDGVPDIIAGNVPSGTDARAVQWRRNDLAGAAKNMSAARVVLTTASGAVYAIELVDLDGDGAVDMLLALSDDLIFYRNTDGRGNLIAQSHLTSSSRIRSNHALSVADVNGDGLLDVVGAWRDPLSSATSSTSLVWWRHLDGNGTFEVSANLRTIELPSGTFSTLQQPVALAVDLTQDGCVDLLVAGVKVLDATLEWLESEATNTTLGSVSFSAPNEIAAWTRATSSSNVAGPAIPVTFGSDPATHLIVGEAEAIVLHRSVNVSCPFANVPRTAVPLVASTFVLDSATWSAAGIVWGFDSEAGFVAQHAPCKSYPAPELWMVGSFYSLSPLEDVIARVGSGGLVAYANRGDNSFEDVAVPALSSTVLLLDVMECEPFDCILVSLLSSKNTVQLLQSNGTAFHEAASVFTGARPLSALRVVGRDVYVGEDGGVITWLTVGTAPNFAVTERVQFDVTVGLGIEDVLTLQFSGIAAGDLTGSGFRDLAVVMRDTLYLVTDVSDDVTRIGFAEVIDEVESDFYVPLFATDINGDGALDCGTARQAYITAPLAFSAPRDVSLFAPEPVFVAAGDVDGDGDEDVVVAVNGESVIKWFDNSDGLGLFAREGITVGPLGGATMVVLADLDGDGTLDVLTNAVEWFANDGSGSFSAAQMISEPAVAVAVADLNGDGHADIVYCRANDTVWHANAGDGTFSSAPLPVASDTRDARAIVVVDMDRDNRTDILITSEDAVAWYRNVDGAGNFSSRVVVSLNATGARSAVAVDVDSDGDLDVVTAVPMDEVVVWIENVDSDGGAAVFSSPHTLNPWTKDPGRFAVGDLDQDGDADLLVVSDVAALPVSWFSNLGDGEFSSAARLSPDSLGATIVALADIDSDGDLDVVAASRLGSAVQWYENQLARTPDTSSSLSCTPQTVLGVGSATPSVCTLISRNGGVLIADTAALFAINVDNEFASVSPLQPGFGSVFTFEVTMSRPGIVRMTEPRAALVPIELDFVVPTPVIVPESLRLVEGFGTSQDGQVIAGGTSSLRVAFEVRKLGLPDESAVTVTYGPDADMSLFSCSSPSLSISGDVTTVSCDTEGQEEIFEIVPLRFRVALFGEESLFDDSNSLELVLAPQVTRVSGCDEDRGFATVGCPLSGGIAVTVYGQRLGVNGTTNVMIGSRLCQTLSIQTPTNLTCRLPASDGGTQLVAPFTVPQNGLSVVYGRPQPLLSYRIPTVLALQGCDAQASDRLHLTNCGRTGETRITIVGENFGELSGGVRVTVGAQECGDLASGELSEEIVALVGATGARALSVLTCRLPPGVLTKNPLLVLDPSARPSRTLALVSYLQCSVGFRNNGTLCDPCELGKFADEESLDECFRCKAGRFANVTGMSACLECADGEVARDTGAASCERCINGTIEEDHQTCKPCSIGKYATDPAAAGCTLCAAGTIAPDEGLSECIPCDMGKAQSQEGQASCLNCTLGEYSDERQLAQCKKCAVGKFAELPGSTQCEGCSPGSVQPQQGKGLCELCLPGRFANTTALAECYACESGTIASELGAVNCTRCALGHIATAGRTCVPCRIGTFSVNPSNSSCDECSRGRVSDDAGLSACRKCPPGRYMGSVGGKLCSSCEQGRYAQNAGATRCDACAVNMYAPVEGSVSCLDCPALQFTREGGQVQCSSCASGRYTLFQADAAVGPDRVYVDCEDCPPGASCDGSGAALADDDIWVVRSADGSVQSARCLPGRCTACDNMPSENRTQLAVACCSKNRAPAEENPMCARCANEFVEWGGECIECTETNYVLLGGLLLAMWLVVLFLHLGLNQQSNPLSLVFFYYTQMVLLLFGEETGWLAWTSFFNFNPIQNASGGRCVAPWSSLTKLAISAVSPLLTWVFLGLTASIHASINACQRSAGVGRDWKTVAAPYWRSCLAFFLFTYNSTTASSLRFFECVDVAGGKWRVLRSAPEIDCTSDEYAAMRPLFVGGLVFVVCGPLIMLYWLHRPRILRLAGRVQGAGASRLRRLSFADKKPDGGASSDKGTPFAHTWSVLFEMYNGEKSYVAHMWNAAVLVRRVLVITTGILLLKYGHRTRYAGLTLAHLAVLVGHLLFMPFRRITVAGEFLGDNAPQSLTQRTVDVNMLETVSLLLLVVFSAVLGSVDLPLNDQQALGLGFVVFTWMAVLMLAILMRLAARKKMKKLSRTREAGRSVSALAGAGLHEMARSGSLSGSTTTAALVPSPGESSRLSSGDVEMAKRED